MTPHPYRVQRLDRTGRDVTDSPGLWGESDCEIVQTVYPHPSITSGQHTNGAATIWIRMPDSEKSEWAYAGLYMHKVRKGWECWGKDFIEGLSTMGKLKSDLRERQKTKESQ